MTVVSEHKDADQYAAKFGKKDGQIVRKLTEKVVNLTKRWQMFLYFFSGPNERVDVLNEASKPTSIVLRDLLWDDALMRIRQMSDPARQGKYENLSMQNLVEIAKKTSVDLNPDYQKAMTTCEPAKRYADKYLAHLDMPHSLGEQESAVARKDTTDAINAICVFVQEFHRSVRDSTYSLIPRSHSDGHQQFLLRLYQGNRAEKDLKAASRAAAEEGDWGAINRPDIPDWITEKHGPMDLF